MNKGPTPIIVNAINIEVVLSIMLPEIWQNFVRFHAIYSYLIRWQCNIQNRSFTLLNT